MTYQIEIAFTGKYKIDADTTIENPIVIGQSANDDLIGSVTCSVLFTSPAYYLSRPIGAFDYTTGWDNNDVISLINSFMAAAKV